MGRLVWIGLLVVGCAPSYPSSCPADTEARFFVIGRWHFAELTEDGRAPGFDLDGRGDDASSYRCDDAVDFISPRTGDTQVDNQFASRLVGFLPERDVSGTMLNPTDMRGIEVCVPRGGNLADATSGVWVHVWPELPAPPVALSGAVYHVRWRATGFGLMRRGADLFGRVGEASIPIVAGFAPLSLSGTQVRFAAEGSLDVRAGELGGGLDMREVVDAANALLGTSIDSGVVETIAQPDLEPVGDGRACNRVSLGVAIDLVPSTLVE